MESRLYDPEIHQDSVVLEDYKFDNIYLQQCISQFRQEHPEATVESMAEHAGLALSTYKKLKEGKIADPRGSTYYLLNKAFGADPRRLMGIKTGSQAQVVPINNNVVESQHARLEEKQIHIDRLENQHLKDLEEMERLRDRLMVSEKENSKFSAASEACDRIISERDTHIGRQENVIRSKSKIIIVLSAILFSVLIIDILLGSAGWFRFGPI